MALVPCPICRRRFDTEKTPAMPFCSVRCQQIDFGRWMSEDYGIPIEPEDEEFEEEIAPNGEQ